MQSNLNFFTATKHGNIQFVPSNAEANIHTKITLAHLVQITGIREKLECDTSKIFNSPSIYINADSFVSGTIEKSSILGIEGIDTIKKLNFLGAENSGVYFHFPGYQFRKYDLCKIFNWLNFGIISFGSGRCVKNFISSPLVIAKH